MTFLPSGYGRFQECHTQQGTKMQAIITKYIGPTNVRGSRVKATAQAGSVTLEWDDALNRDDNHMAAAKALATKLGWDYGEFIAGTLPDGCDVWVLNAKTSDRFTVQKQERAA